MSAVLTIPGRMKDQDRQDPGKRCREWPIRFTPHGPRLGIRPQRAGGAGTPLDRAGDDTYAAEKWAQGYGTVGPSVLLDEAGADSYSVGAGDGQAWTGGTGVGYDR